MMAPYVDGSPVKPFAYFCLVSFSGTTIDGDEVADIFIKMTDARTKEEAEYRILEYLADRPRKGFCLQRYKIVHTQDIHPEDLEDLVGRTKDAPDAGMFGEGKYSGGISKPDTLI